MYLEILMPDGNKSVLVFYSYPKMEYGWIWASSISDVMFLKAILFSKIISELNFNFNYLGYSTILSP